MEAAAEPNRRKLLQLLASGEQTVQELASRFEVSRPAISQHLAVLQSAGLVSARREGRFRYYQVEPAGIAELRRIIDTFWTSELDLLVADARAAGKTLRGTGGGYAGSTDANKEEEPP
ncbi:ArsR/SmtB family transcription factor [Arthrobacter sp. GCM10027362]|uniref:ArsR/SmtB family transcription factor n=1 Tax=Arthrobacter sp. GCM10027362 TaxID=3273379 RepID=UPI0036363887